MSKKYRNPLTGEIFTLEEVEEVDEEVSGTPTKKVDSSVNPETPEGAEPEKGVGKTPSKNKSGFSWTPFDVLDEIDGKDVEKIALVPRLASAACLPSRGCAPSSTVIRLVTMHRLPTSSDRRYYEVEANARARKSLPQSS